MVSRFRRLVLQALAWPFLEDQQRLVWAAVLEFDAVPTQEREPSLVKGRREWLRFFATFEAAPPACMPGVASMVLPAARLHPPPARPGSQQTYWSTSYMPMLKDPESAVAPISHLQPNEKQVWTSSAWTGGGRFSAGLGTPPTWM